MDEVAVFENIERLQIRTKNECDKIDRIIALNEKYRKNFHV